MNWLINAHVLFFRHLTNYFEISQENNNLLHWKKNVKAFIVRLVVKHLALECLY